MVFTLLFTIEFSVAASGRTVHGVLPVCLSQLMFWLHLENIPGFGFGPIGHADSPGCSFPVQRAEAGDIRTQSRVHDLNWELGREKTKITKNVFISKIP